MTTEAESTAVATRDYDAPPPALVVGNPGTALLPSRDDMKLMTDIAKTVFAAGGSMVPKHITTSYQALAVMIAGHELGLRPMTSLRHVYIVNGKTEIETRAMVGIVKARDSRIQFEWPEYTSDAVTCIVKRPGQTPVTVRYTRDDAKASGQLKPGPWTSYTRDMLYAAATKRAVRLSCPDIINAIDSGLQHTVIEAEAVDVTVSEQPYEAPPASPTNGIPPEAFNEGDDGSMPVEHLEATDDDKRAASMEAQHAVATAEEVAAARTETLLPAARELLKKLTSDYAPGVIKRLVDGYGAEGKRTAAGNAALSQYTEAELERLLAAMRHIEQQGDLPPADGEQGALDA